MSRPKLADAVHRAATNTEEQVSDPQEVKKDVQHPSIFRSVGKAKSQLQAFMTQQSANNSRKSL